MCAPIRKLNPKPCYNIYNKQNAKSISQNAFFFEKISPIVCFELICIENQHFLC